MRRADLVVGRDYVRCAAREWRNRGAAWSRVRVLARSPWHELWACVATNPDSVGVIVVPNLADGAVPEGAIASHDDDASASVTTIPLRMGMEIDTAPRARGVLVLTDRGTLSIADIGHLRDEWGGAEERRAADEAARLARREAQRRVEAEAERVREAARATERLRRGQERDAFRAAFERVFGANVPGVTWRDDYVSVATSAYPRMTVGLGGLTGRDAAEILRRIVDACDWGEQGDTSVMQQVRADALALLAGVEHGASRPEDAELTRTAVPRIV
jgi:hypothetical protein